MTNKLEYYDILGILVPGILLICWIPLCFPEVVQITSQIKLPDSFKILALTAGAIFTGQIIQTIGSLLEPIIFKTWGGRPSDIALTKGLGDRYLPEGSGKRIAPKLKKIAEPNATEPSLFLMAMQIAESDGKSRAARFNALYAYHRALLVFIILALFLMLASLFLSAVAKWSCGQTGFTTIVLVSLACLVWYRAKQRSFYYVREVLLAAERVVDERAVKNVEAE